MKKALYTREEIVSLISSLDQLSANDDNEHDIVYENLDYYNSLNDEERELYNAHQLIAGEAYTIECRAKVLRKVAKILRCPIKDVPKEINNDNEVITAIARWRLTLNK